VIEPLYRYTSIPTVEQLSTYNATTRSVSIDVDPAAGAYDILIGLPTIHARSVTLFLECTVALNSVQFRKWAANRTIDVFEAASGALVAGVTLGYTSTSTLGETLDLRINKAVTLPGTIIAWLCARA
jgi:hypothetical protein